MFPAGGWEIDSAPHQISCSHLLECRMVRFVAVLFAGHHDRRWVGCRATVVGLTFHLHVENRRGACLSVANFAFGSVRWSWLAHGCLTEVVLMWIGLVTEVLTCLAPTGFRTLRVGGQNLGLD